MTNDKKVLVTGGAGFIGSHVVEELVRDGQTVTVLDLKAADAAPNLAAVREQIEYVSGDIRDAAVMDQLCRAHTRIIHLAALVSVPESVADPVTYNATNVDGTLQVFKSAAAGGVTRVVYASSAAVYGDAGTAAVSETDPTDPRSPYAVQKLVNELYARYYSETTDLETIGLRFFNVYGDRQDPTSSYSGIITILRQHLLAGTEATIFGDGEQTRDYIHVSDVARACALALTNGTSGAVYNVATGHKTSLNELVTQLSAAAGTPINTTHGPERAGDVRHSLAEVQKAAAELDFTASVDLSAGLATLLTK